MTIEANTITVLVTLDEGDSIEGSCEWTLNETRDVVSVLSSSLLADAPAGARELLKELAMALQYAIESIEAEIGQAP